MNNETVFTFTHRAVFLKGAADQELDEIQMVPSTL